MPAAFARWALKNGIWSFPHRPSLDPVKTNQIMHFSVDSEVARTHIRKVLWTSACSYQPFKSNMVATWNAGYHFPMTTIKVLNKEDVINCYSVLVMQINVWLFVFQPSAHHASSTNSKNQITVPGSDQVLSQRLWFWKEERPRKRVSKR